MQSTILVRYVAFTIMRDLLFCLLFLGRLACRNTGFVVVSLLFDSAHCILYICISLYCISVQLESDHCTLHWPMQSTILVVLLVCQNFLFVGH